MSARDDVFADEMRDDAPAAEVRGDGTPQAGSSFFQNTACPYFPCHDGVDPAQFNCLFCYCPLYALGPSCGGDFRYTEKGVKDCTACTKPHEGEAGVRLVKERFPQIAELARRKS